MYKSPEIQVFAGPNGSGKSTITAYAEISQPYINADEIKKVAFCSDLEAARLAHKLRCIQINKKESFSFETVLSTDRNLNLLKQAKKAGFFIKGFYVLTSDPNINVTRVMARVSQGGHDVPAEKVVSRYYKAMALVPEFIKVCDICHIYDNSQMIFRIFKKRKDEYFYWENEFWNKSDIIKLTGVEV